MIIAKQIINLYEKYSAIGSIRGHAVTVYENPTSSDYINMRDETRKVYPHENPPYKITDVRFIADAKDQKFYVVDATLAEHSTLRRLTKIPTTGYIPYLLEGIASLSNGKLNARTVFPYTRDKTKFFSYNWSFVDKYINGFSAVLDSSEVLSHFK
jgi:hypothetical protein